jgi:hypothetical protein
MKKGERVENPKDYIISVRLPLQEYEQYQKWCHYNFVRPSAYTRELIQAHLASADFSPKEWRRKA